MDTQWSDLITTPLGSKEIQYHNLQRDQVSQQYKLCVLMSLALIGRMVLPTWLTSWRKPPIYTVVKDSVYVVDASLFEMMFM